MTIEINFEKYFIGIKNFFVYLFWATCDFIKIWWNCWDEPALNDEPGIIFVPNLLIFVLFASFSFINAGIVFKLICFTVVGFVGLILLRGIWRLIKFFAGK